MAPRRFTTTRLSGLRAAGRTVELQHAVLAPFLERELGPRHGRLFAEFEPEGSDLRGWYADAEAPPRRVGDLPADRTATLRAATAGLVGDVIALAERLAGGGPQKAALARALLAATTFPEEDIWCDGDQPLIVNWGFHRQDVPEGTPRAILELARPRGRPPAAEVAAPPPLAPVPAMRPRPSAAWARIGWALPLWLIFALLVAACDRLLLPACGFGWPWSPAHACAAPGDGTAEAAEGARLQALVRDAELRVAEERRLCVPPTRETRNEGRGGEGRSGEVERRLPAGAPRGEVEISLLWEGHADLDLIVGCPGGGRLSQASPGLAACGGRLLRDVNKSGEALLDHPIEHAAWDHPPPGPYTADVKLFGYNDALETDVPFTVRVRRGADEMLYQGRIRGAGSTVTAASVAF